MSKAKERALEAYPHYTAENITEVTNARRFFAKGYEQAEKDLALTAEDIRTIYELTENVSNHSFWAKYSSGFWNEVLTRFKQYKEEKK